MNSHRVDEALTMGGWKREANDGHRGYCTCTAGCAGFALVWLSSWWAVTALKGKSSQNASSLRLTLHYIENPGRQVGGS